MALKGAGVIRTFSCRRTASIFEGEAPKGFSVEIARAAYIRLHQIDRANRIEFLSVPASNHLEKIKGYPDLWSIRVNRQFRIAFRWVDGAAEDVQLVDYH